MALATLGSYTFKVNPTAINWSYTVNTQAFETKGGRVIQILGCSIDAITVDGSFGGKSRTQTHQEMKDFEQSFLKMVDAQMSTGQSVTFNYPPRGWNSRVYLKAFPSVKIDPSVVVPKFSLTLIPDGGFDDLLELSKAQAAAQFSNIVDGIMWHPSDYTDMGLASSATQQKMWDSLKAEYQSGMSGAWMTAENAGLVPTAPTPASSSPAVGVGYSFDYKNGIMLDGTPYGGLGAR